MRVERWVIDTNVLISAALLPESTPARLLQRALREVRLVFSPATFAELEQRLWRPKFDRYLTVETRQRLLRDLDAVADWVEPSSSERYSRDPDDDAFVHAALCAEAACVVSGDRDLLDLGQVGSIPILTPAQALRRLLDKLR